MIRRALDDGSDLLITQDEHARQAGRLAARHRDLPGPGGRIARAIRLHDSGWPLLDDRPEPLADGRPPHVFEMPGGVSVPAWRRSIAVARAVGPLEALVVGGHFARFSRRFRAETEPWRAVWRIGVDPAVERAAIDLCALCDALSLRLLCDPEVTVRLPEGMRCENGRLDPWPFDADVIEDTVVGRRIERRRWSSAAELQAACRAAPLVPFPTRLRPFGVK